MTRSDDDRTISIEQDGRTVASAEVRPAGPPGVVHSDLHAESGKVGAVVEAALLERRERRRRFCEPAIGLQSGLHGDSLSRDGREPARARRTASRSGSRTRRNQALCHSQAAPQVEHKTSAELPDSVSGAIAVPS